MAELNPAEQMRVMLDAMRSEGWSFARAWPNAIQRIRVQPYMTAEEADDLAEWKHWLEWARPAFAAAFVHQPPPPLPGGQKLPGDLSAAPLAPVVHH